MKIGFFDSGIGGITVLHDALRILPNEDYIYYADTRHVPYGDKSKSQVRQYVLEAVDFVVRQGVKAVVIACNTATSVAIKDLRSVYDVPIIGMEPAVKPAVERKISADKRVLVTATALTLQEEKLKNLITALDNNHIVDLLPLPKLVQFAERLEFGEATVRPYLQAQLQRYDLEQYETLVLGCTHFSFFTDIFRMLLPAHIDILDGNMGTVKHLKRILDRQNTVHDGSGQVVFYHSGSLIDQQADIDRYSDLLKRLEGMHMKTSTT